jgi:hypothetical protein
MIIRRLGTALILVAAFIGAGCYLEDHSYNSRSRFTSEAEILQLVSERRCKEAWKLLSPRAMSGEPRFMILLADLLDASRIKIPDSNPSRESTLRISSTLRLGAYGTGDTASDEKLRSVLRSNANMQPAGSDVFACLRDAGTSKDLIKTCSEAAENTAVTEKFFDFYWVTMMRSDSAKCGSAR